MNNTSAECILMLISTFTNALLKSKVVFVNISQCFVNQWKTVFSLTNINEVD